MGRKKPERRDRIKLSDRLLMSASRVTPGNVVADVGCDHAHTAIWLVKQGIAPRAIAMVTSTVRSVKYLSFVFMCYF